MRKIIDKNRRKLLAIFGIVLMIAFVAQMGMPGSRGGGGPDAVAATVLGENVTGSELAAANREWELLKVMGRVEETFGRQGTEQRFIPALEEIFSKGFDRGFGAYMRQVLSQLDGAHYHQLVREARKLNIRPAEDEVKNYSQSLVAAAGTGLDAATRERAVRNILAVRDAYMRTVAAGIHVPPALALRVASDAQAEISVNLAQYSVAEFGATTQPATRPAAATIPTTASTGGVTAGATTTATTTAVAAAETQPAAAATQLAGPATVAELAFFNQYKDKLAAGPDVKENPLGFGYKYPDRVKVDVITVNLDDLKAGVFVSDLAVRRRYLASPERYPATSQPATSQPAATQAAATQAVTQPGTRPAVAAVAAATQVAATGPATTRAVAAGPTTRTAYEEHKEEIRKEIALAVAQNLLVALFDEAQSKFGEDFATYQEAMKAKAPAPKSSLGPAYDTPEYLFRFQEYVNRRLNERYPAIYQQVAQEAPTRRLVILVPVERFARDWLTAEDVTKLPGIGRAYNPARAQGQQELPFAQYVMERTLAFMSEADQKAARAGMIPPPLAIMQFSKELVDEESRFARTVKTLHLFRVIAADPAHAPADVAYVLPQVRQDMVTRDAYDKALARAKGLAKRAEQVGLQAAGNEMGKSQLATTGLFRRRNVLQFQGQTFPMDITGFAVEEPSRSKFTSEAFDLLTEHAGGRARPVKVIELPRERKVVVAELNPEKLEPLRQGERLYTQVAGARAQAQQELTLIMAIQWFNPAELEKRVSWVNKTPAGAGESDRERTPAPAQRPRPLGL